MTTTRDYLRANLFDGDESGDLTVPIATFLAELTEVVDEYLALREVRATAAESASVALREALAEALRECHGRENAHVVGVQPYHEHRTSVPNCGLCASRADCVWCNLLALPATGDDAARLRERHEAPDAAEVARRALADLRLLIVEAFSVNEEQDSPAAAHHWIALIDSALSRLPAPTPPAQDDGR